MNCSGGGDNDVIKFSDVLSAINSLKCRKSCGPDGLPVKAIKFGGNELAVHLTLLFNMFCCHCYIPSEFIKTTIMPLLKNKACDSTDINNYRAIALSNSLSKVLQSVLLNSFQTCDRSDDMYQFGFKKNIPQHWDILFLNMLLITIGKR